MAKTFIFEDPNRYGLQYNSELAALGSYVEGGPGVEVFGPDQFDQFFQYATKEECLQKALSIDPSFSKNKIFGPIKLTLVDSTPDAVAGVVGQAVVLFCDFKTDEIGVSVSYQWYDPQNTPILTATSSSFTFTPSSKEFSGTYRCIATASGEYNWTGESAYECNVSLSAPLNY